MSQIGTFTRTPDGFFGRIRTLTLDAEVAILPADDTDAENAPEHRVFLDGVEVGAAWERTSEKAGTWLSLTIDDPSFAEPVRARLFEADAKKGTWGLHWSRRMRRDSERDVMCGNRSCTSFFSLPSIDHVPVTPLDPIANVEAVARSEGQGRRRFFRLTVMLSTVARPENIGRRRSLALDRSEHDGRLMGHRDGGACATVPAIMAMFCASMIVTAFSSPAFAGKRAIDTPNDRATVASSARDRSHSRSPIDADDADPWSEHIAEAASRFAIPERWIRAVMAVESAGDVRALSSAGAMGLMQIMPATWEELRLKHGFGNDAYDVRNNILAGSAYLRAMHDRYGSIAAMLAAYNAGPGRYERHLAGERLPAETIAYVARVMPMIGADSDIPLSARRSSDDRKTATTPIFAGSSIDRHHDVKTAADLPAERGHVTVRSTFSPLSDGLFVRRPEP
ncbi:MAG TPA: DUF736 family protein [Rhizobium sp.]